MQKYEIEQIVNNFEHALRVMISDPNVKTYQINNMSFYREDNDYCIIITDCNINNQ